MEPLFVRLYHHITMKEQVTASLVSLVKNLEECE